MKKGVLDFTIPFDQQEKLHEQVKKMVSDSWEHVKSTKVSIPLKSSSDAHKQKKESNER